MEQGSGQTTLPGRALNRTNCNFAVVAGKVASGEEGQRSALMALALAPRSVYSRGATAVVIEDCGGAATEIAASRREAEGEEDGGRHNPFFRHLRPLLPPPIPSAPISIAAPPLSLAPTVVATLPHTHIWAKADAITALRCSLLFARCSLPGHKAVEFGLAPGRATRSCPPPPCCIPDSPRPTRTRISFIETSPSNLDASDNPWPISLLLGVLEC